MNTGTFAPQPKGIDIATTRLEMAIETNRMLAQELHSRLRMVTTPTQPEVAKNQAAECGDPKCEYANRLADGELALQMSNSILSDILGRLDL